jgi:hypothetical protein
MARQLSCWAGFETITILGRGEAEQPKGPGTPEWEGSSGRMNSAERETGKRATESWKRTQREDGGAEGAWR